MLSLRTVAGCIATAGLFVIASIVMLSACSPQELPPRTTLELMGDPAVRDAVLLRCNQLQEMALRDAECRNVREAVDRLAAEAQEQQTEETKQDAEESFEKARDALRARDERERRRQEASEKPVDPYTLPLVPDQPLETVPVTASRSVDASPQS